MALVVECPAFGSGAPIPVVFTEDGQDFSPELQWGPAPKDVQEWILIVDDPDAPTPEPWVHWLLYNLAPRCLALPGALPPVRELAEPAGGRQGLNSWGSIGYRGPAPPKGHGVHRYQFRVHALSKRLGLPAGMTRNQLRQAMLGHVLDEGVLVGTYKR